MAIENQQLTTGQLDLLTVPASKEYAITTVMVCNKDSSSTASFDMHLVKSGEAVSNNKTIIVNELSLPPGETFTFDSEKIVLGEGDKLSFVAEPDIGAALTNLVATVSYLEV
mgnify:FL=1|jgi:hypothetical protein|tara:strand:+ start:1627 stop:1962 length:336 start_codon:yes stop_codon:yes gene_type:complete